MGWAGFAPVHVVVALQDTDRSHTHNHHVVAVAAGAAARGASPAPGPVVPPPIRVRRVPRPSSTVHTRRRTDEEQRPYQPTKPPTVSRCRMGRAAKVRGGEARETVPDCPRNARRVSRQRKAHLTKPRAPTQKKPVVKESAQLTRPSRTRIKDGACTAMPDEHVMISFGCIAT
jgi:hypothetical protein